MTVDAVDEGDALALQKAVFAAVAADGTMKALIGDPVRLFDRVTPGALFPYVRFGAHLETGGDTVCTPLLRYQGEDHDLTLDVFSRAVGSTEAKQIASALRRCLSNRELDVAGFGKTLLTHRETRTMQDPDGLTTHCAVAFSAITEPVL